MTDEELVKVSDTFRTGLLGDTPSFRACAMVCWPLEGFLNAIHGINCRSREVKFDHHLVGNHVFIELEDGRVLDPTYDQFGADLPRVYLGKPVPGIHREGEP